MGTNHPGVIAVARSENSKIGTVAATYVSQVSCPKSCPFMKSGCYAESGPMGGYAAAVVVSEHASLDGKATLRDGVRVIPCPQQTGKSASCVTCGLCFDADRLRDGKMVIEFATHGSGVKKATNALVQIGGSNAIN